jgi:soluble lytic murein transglycosylase
MILRRLLAVLVAAAALTPVQAQQSDRRASLRAAFDAADAGQLDPEHAVRFARDPLYPWLQANVLRRQVATASPAQVHTLLQALGEQPAARWLRPIWLAELAKRQDWNNFRLDYRASDDLALRCADLSSRMDLPPSQQGSWNADARQLWLTGSSLPAACDAPLARFGQSGQLDDGLRWQRLDLAVAAGEVGLVRFLAKGMRPEAAALAQSYADYLAAPSAPLPVDWPTNERSRAVVTLALAKQAKRDPDRAEQLLAQLPASALDAGQRGQVAYEIARWTVASYLPASADRLAAVPASAYDDKLHEWQVREAISRSDDAGALAAIARMGEKQRNDSRWQYFEARLRERLGQSAASRALYEKAASAPTFHGWLAADRLQRPYALCALEPSKDGQLARRVAGNAGLARALDLFAIDRPELAAREWSSAVKPMNDDERRIAVQRAIAEGWYDRAVFGMGVVPDDLRHYSLRFPLHHENDIRAQSQANGLDPAWVAGETRAESSFMPKARSGADARGLMQLLPGTGALTAQRLGLPWLGGESLYEPTTNIVLGTAYLRQMLDRFGGLPYLAIAAYNAGPSPVERWRLARPRLEPDFFIETIPYKETREYVARVLGFSVVYDWRLNGTAAPLSERLLGRLVREPSQRRSFSCPTGIARNP